MTDMLDRTHLGRSDEFRSKPVARTMTSPAASRAISVASGTHREIVEGVSASYRLGNAPVVLVGKDDLPKVLPDLKDHAQYQGGDIVTVTSPRHIGEVVMPNLGLVVMEDVMQDATMMSFLTEL